MHRKFTLRIPAGIVREWPVVALLLFFGIVYATILDSYGMFMWDEAEYASIARSVAQGQGFAISGHPNPLRPPVLPLAGAASMILAGNSARPGRTARPGAAAESIDAAGRAARALAGNRFDDSVLRATSCGFALLALLGVYLFAGAALDRTTGLVAAALLGMSPFFWISVPLFLSEIPFMAFFAAAVWSFWFGAFRNQRFFVLSWIFWALSFLTRYTASLFLPVIVVSIPAALWLGGAQEPPDPAPDIGGTARSAGSGGVTGACSPRDRTRRRFRSRAFFLGPLAGLLVLAPWLIREGVTFRDPLTGLKQASTQMQIYMPGVSMPWHFYIDRLPAMLSPAVAVLFVAGVAWALRKAGGFELHNVLAAAVILLWFSCYRYKEERIVSSALPFMAVTAATALTKATARLRKPLRLGVHSVVLTGIFVLSSLAAIPALEHSYTLGYPCFLDAMAFLRDRATPGAVVMGANSPQIAWYSGLRVIDFPEKEDLPRALRQSEWVVITNFERGQKPYVSELARRLAGPSSEDAVLFQDGRYATAVIRSTLLLPGSVP